MALFAYMQQLQRFLHDQRIEMIDPADLIEYINIARREVAMRSQILRVLTPISGAIKTVAVLNGGSGYSAPVVTISPPDFPSGSGNTPNGAQATATAAMSGGVITGINVAYGGSGYFMPLVTITDPTGTGAVLKPQLSLFNSLAGGQEVYPFSGVDLSSFPGVGAIYMVKSVSLIYANYRYSLPIYAFSVYQAKIRQYPFQYQYIPSMGSQFGQGTNGSFFLYPIASSQYQMEWDAFCLPQDLIDNESVEALPMPWTEAVPYFAAHLAFLELQNANSARLYLELFDMRVGRYGQYARPGRTVNPYGRY